MYISGQGVKQNFKMAIECYQKAAKKGHEAAKVLCEACERFLKGKLIYKPNEKNEEGKIELRIADLANPLDGEFDLSKCGDIGKYLSINTGYRKSKRAENKDKVEIWFVPHFLIEKNLAGTASHFKDIIGSWDSRPASVGTFFTWGRWDDLGWYDYAINLDWALFYDGEAPQQISSHHSDNSHALYRDFGNRLRHIHAIFDETTKKTEEQFQLGEIYAKGQGVKQDFKRAFTHYLNAAREGHAIAHFQLAEMCARGQGVPQDFETALYWYIGAAERDHEAAKALCESIRGHEAIYARFLKGKLIYKPDEKSDIGKIEMRIADLSNPLDGEFDLSGCGDAGKYLSINTGYRKNKRPENASKHEIWFVPYFFFEKNLQGAANLPRPIMRSWGKYSPTTVGMFFNGGIGDFDFCEYETGLKWEDYNNTQSIDELHTKYASSFPDFEGLWPLPPIAKKFFMLFVN